ncbi:hypothetical protein B0T10DRAFT_407209 [Thelonectria olida]|uniref:Amine oxidase domain-containing protein n=1 Tax=Thelonectria olida TaxID=1576542 RepID=A0A9P9ANS4_9HYPO|nr:hypothetical protein B0T10DRAFT_407209 [Thelonectria olida]
MATDGPYKHQWARHVARKTLDDDLAAARLRIHEATKEISNVNIELGKDAPVSEVLAKTKNFTGLGFVPPEPGKFKVGIVGAGVAGLFTAMVFDWLNKEVKDLHIDYDIIEAAGEDRVGGRLYTHKFSEKEHDYYDVGAMRFPNNEVMKRTFQLFDFIGLKEEKGGLIPYYFPPTDDKVCPSYFNDIQFRGNVWNEPGVCDPFRLNSGLPDDAVIPPDVLDENPAKLVAKALKKFTDEAKKRFDTLRKEIAANKEMDPNSPHATALWALLMKADNMSVRQFLASYTKYNAHTIPRDDNGKDIPKGPKFNYNTIEWLETATFGTGWYDQALSECVLEELDFDVPEDTEHDYWFCVDGGAQRIARIMATKINKPVQTHSQVLGINAHTNDRQDPEKYVPISLDIKKTNPYTKKTEKRSEDYFAVFNSTTLPALQRMDLKDAGLLWGTKQAIRSLGYGASCKVAIKFKTPWWQLEPFNINKGGVARTDLPLRVCVYPSYNIPSAQQSWSATESSVLLCSYTWGQDAQRLGSLISPNTPEDEEQLKSVLLHNIALMHANKDTKTYEELMELLEDQYQTHHAWDWYRDQNMSGAFAYFGPGQFSNMWQEIIKPNAFGQLYLVGEVASSHHAWIVGALESVIRAVYVMFEGLKSNDKKCEAYKIASDLLSKGPIKTQEVPEKKEPWELPTGLPFYPLPDEMPERQLYTQRDTKTTDDPTKAKDSEEFDLSYPAAIALLSLVESYFELMYKVEPTAATAAATA